MKKMDILVYALGIAALAFCVYIISIELSA